MQREKTYSKSSLFNVVRNLVETHVPKHHDGTEQKSSRVGKTLAGNVGSGTVNGLEDGSVLANVTGGGETETTDETGGKIRENVTVKLLSERW
jgi:hypothetical protein